jgi:bacteriophage N4 adsorption protein B
LLSGLDDLFIDTCYGLRSLYRRVFVLPRYRSLSEQDLLVCPEQLIAVMIPAWDESAVIRPMLHNAVRTLNYRNFHIFVGTYPNDSDTHREVEIVRERYDNVHRIVCPHDGPTNKADCLNWIYQGIKVFEKENGIRFKIFIMQDCEDVIHPLCYKLFNYLIPRKDMVQLPVHSMKRKWYEFTAGHYIDEFSQLHFKDLVVREHLNRSIPAAGVGCAFSRRAFEIVAKKNNNQLFSIDSLTEDYDFGFRLKEHGLKQVFVRFAIIRTVMRPGFWTGKPRQVRIKELVCVREYFPASYWAAVRQRSRWVLGIALQGWANLGWRGDVWTKYMLFRDRKVLLTNLVNLLGYLVVFAVLAVWMTLWLNPDAYHYPPLLEKGSALWYVVIANAYLLGERIALRAFCVQRIHGWQQAFLSIPRMVWGNIINFSATCRAISLYSRYLRTGKFISWDKTVHVFPSEAELQAFRRKLGDLLLERRLITSRQLDEALARQKVEHRLLGSILIEMGVVREDDLMEALSITQA